MRACAAAVVGWMCAALWMVGIPARGDVVYDNFGAGDTFDASGGVNVSNFIRVAAPFTPAATATATDLVVAMSTDATDPVVVILSVTADASGRPGMTLGSVEIAVMPGAAAVYQGTLPVGVAVDAGTQYWVKAVPSGLSSPNLTWQTNATGAVGVATTLPTGLWIPSATGATPALRVEDNSAPPLAGACCAGSTCAVTLPTMCNARGTRFAGIGTTRNAAGNSASPCCKADFDQSGDLSVQDVFDFLSAWFAGDDRADFNGGGLAVQDIFDYLNAWFAGC